MDSSNGQGGGGGGADRLSGLPEDLLHDILLRLRCIKAAARTGALSRHWRRAWTRLPVLHLWVLDPVLPASCVSIVDAVLAACSAPTLSRLVIQSHDVNLPGDGVTAAHAAAWLRFASERVAGELFLWLPSDMCWKRPEQDLELPVCAATATIEIHLRRNFRLRPPAAAGAFAALRRLAIGNGIMDSRELEALVSSSRCPCLEELSLKVRLAPDSDVSIHSDSLRWLSFHVENTRRLVVAAPLLHKVCVSKAVEAYIAAPKLAEVEFRYNNDMYTIAEAGRHLQRLVISLQFPVPPIMRRFDTIGELIVDAISIPPGGYKMFMMSMGKLDCETLVLPPMWTCHGFSPCMLHLLRMCNGLRKFVVTLDSIMENFRCPPDCPCTWPENFRTDNFVLDSLEEIKINGFTGQDHQLEHVNLLLSCNVPLLKRVVFSISPSDYVGYADIIREKIRGMLPPGIEYWVCVECRNYGIPQFLNCYA